MAEWGGLGGVGLGGVRSLVQQVPRLLRTIQLHFGRVVPGKGGLHGGDLGFEGGVLLHSRPVHPVQHRGPPVWCACESEGESKK